MFNYIIHSVPSWYSYKHPYSNPLVLCCFTLWTLAIQDLRRSRQHPAEASSWHRDRHSWRAHGPACHSDQMDASIFCVISSEKKKKIYIYIICILYNIYIYMWYHIFIIYNIIHLFTYLDRTGLYCWGRCLPLLKDDNHGAIWVEPPSRGNGRDAGSRQTTGTWG